LLGGSGLQVHLYDSQGLSRTVGPSSGASGVDLVLSGVEPRPAPPPLNRLAQVDVGLPDPIIGPTERLVHHLKVGIRVPPGPSPLRLGFADRRPAPTKREVVLSKTTQGLGEGNRAKRIGGRGGLHVGLRLHSPILRANEGRPAPAPGKKKEEKGTVSVHPSRRTERAHSSPAYRRPSAPFPLCRRIVSEQGDCTVVGIGRRQGRGRTEP